MASNCSNFDPVVVIGGGFAGLTTVLALSQSLQRPPIILIEPSPRFVFFPFLYELLSEELSLWQVAPSYKSVLKGRGVLLIQDYVERIDVKAKKVLTASGLSFNYSYVVLATGSVPNCLGVPGIRENAFTFHSLEDVDRLKKTINELKDCQEEKKSLVVVGGGATGVELACKLADLVDANTQIHLIESGKHALPYGKKFNQRNLQKALGKRHVEIHLETRVLKIGSNKVLCVSYKNQEPKTFSLAHKGVVWTAGTTANIPNLFKEFPLKRGRILINKYLQIIGFKDAFALGDAACCAKGSWPLNAQVAIQQGKSAAKILIALRAGKIPKQFHFFDYGEMISLGVGHATIKLLGFPLSGTFAFLIRRLIYRAKIQRLLLVSLLLRGSFLDT